MAIGGFNHKGLAELFHNGSSKRIAKALHERTIELLDVLAAATGPQDLRGVSGFHQLQGKRRGTYSMHVNGPWCVTFRFRQGSVVDVDLENYP